MSPDSTKPEDKTVFPPKDLLNSVFNNPGSAIVNQDFSHALAMEARHAAEAFEKTLDFFYRPGIFIEGFRKGEHVRAMLDREGLTHLFDDVPPKEVLKAVKTLYEAGEITRSPDKPETDISPRLDSARETVRSYDPVSKWLYREPVAPIETSKPSTVQYAVPLKFGL